jgi:hypothetical protein
MTDARSRRDLARSATALLRAANLSAAGELRDNAWKRRKRVERRRAKRRAREKEAMLVGSFGAASAARSVNK